jgi:hypothetical protein
MSFLVLMERDGVLLPEALESFVALPGRFGSDPGCLQSCSGLGPLLFAGHGLQARKPGL